MIHKPEVLQHPDQPRGTACHPDFGIAHLARIEGDGGEDLCLTLSGVVMGTPLYMAPKQAQGKTGAIDTRTDVYSLGVILYELATGKLPFEARESFALMKAVIEEEPRRPSSFGLKLAKDLEAVILKAIAKEKDRRYASALTLADDLQSFLDRKPVTAVPDTASYRPPSGRADIRELTATIAVAVLLLGAAIAKIVLTLLDLEAALARAEQKTNEAISAGKRADDNLRSTRRSRSNAKIWPAARGCFERCPSSPTWKRSRDKWMKSNAATRSSRRTLLAWQDQLDKGRCVEAIAFFDASIRFDPTR